MVGAATPSLRGLSVGEWAGGNRPLGKPSPLGFQEGREWPQQRLWEYKGPHTPHHTLALELVVNRRDAMVQSRLRGRVGGCTLARV